MHLLTKQMHLMFPVCPCCLYTREGASSPTGSAPYPPRAGQRARGWVGPMIPKASTVQPRPDPPMTSTAWAALPQAGRGPTPTPTRQENGFPSRLRWPLTTSRFIPWPPNFFLNIRQVKIHKPSLLICNEMRNETFRYM